MKNLTNTLSSQDLSLQPLDERELSTIEGGFLAPLALAFGLASGVALIAYGAGYLYGRWACH